MDCIIYYHTDISLENIGNNIGDLFSIKPVQTISGVILQNELFEIELRQYKYGLRFGEYIQFPEFLLFNHVLDYEHKKKNDEDAQIEIVGKILNQFWENGIPAVAVCTYDAFLPHNGGYLSKEVPWPNEIVDVD